MLVPKLIVLVVGVPLVAWVVVMAIGVLMVVFGGDDIEHR